MKFGRLHENSIIETFVVAVEELFMLTRNVAVIGKTFKDLPKMENNDN